MLGRPASLYWGLTMISSNVLGTAIGLVFCYASLALIVSSINEGISSFLNLRANFLLTSIKQLLNDPGFDDLALKLYNDARINPAGDGNTAPGSTPAFKPSYVASPAFAAALISAIETIPGDFAQLGSDIAVISNPQIRAVLMAFYTKAQGNADAFSAAVSHWFDLSMDRLSGVYKRWSQAICFLIAFLIAAALNVDSFHLFRTLWLDPTLTIEAAIPDAPHAWSDLASLPIGWSTFPPKLDWTLTAALVGWLVTATSSIFGAPFWFDVLQQLTQIRGTGSKPHS